MYFNKIFLLFYKKNRFIINLIRIYYNKFHLNYQSIYFIPTIIKHAVFCIHNTIRLQYCYHILIRIHFKPTKLTIRHVLLYLLPLLLFLSTQKVYYYLSIFIIDQQIHTHWLHLLNIILGIIRNSTTNLKLFFFSILLLVLNVP